MLLPEPLLGHHAGGPRAAVWYETRPLEAAPGIWRHAADAAARTLIERHRVDAAGRIGWSGIDAGNAADFYGGLPGVAFFLAAHGAETGHQAARELGARVIDQCLERWRETAAKRVPARLGGLQGDAALAYGAVGAGRFLGRSDWLDQAAGVLLATLDPPPLDAEVDVVHGAAGTLLVALAVASALPAGDARRGALRRLAYGCGDLALARLAAGAGGPRPGGAARSGFAHGLSGIAVALARLDAESGSPELRRAVASALDAEDRLFVAEAGNWLPAPGASRRPVAWCFGAPGIALARLALLDCPAGAALEERLRNDLGVALATTWTAPKVPFDHVCCGSLGRAEALLAGAERQPAPEARAAAETIAYFVLRVARGRGGYRTDEAGELPFFPGLAGIGYTFLRLASARPLPSPLLLE
jgi:lantibiotic modifying enzyme